MHITKEPRTESPAHELLEELLTYDDLFLDFFNAFLALPAFPLRLHYDRLTGRLQELDGFLLESPRPLVEDTNCPSYGATDTERERTLSWLTQERFLPFQRTVFYLEYKLAKLLICPLDEHYPVSRYAIRGYSRQSDSAMVSSIPSHSSTGRQPTGVPGHELRRLPSQTRSTPACLGRFASFSGQSSRKVSLAFPDILNLADSPVAEHLSRQQHQSFQSASRGDRTSRRTMSGWTSVGEPVASPSHLNRDTSASLPDQELTEHHTDQDCKRLFSGPRKILQFDLNKKNNLQEAEDSSLGYGFGSAGLQQLKEDILGTRAGMESFREFLHDTLGIHLLDFWIDCEDFMEHQRHMEATATPQEIQLFFFTALRSIQAKYKLTIPPACQEQPGEITASEETAFAILSRNQYDALRRLRSYWVPRFLIHYQRTSQLGFGPLKEEVLLNTGFLSSFNIAPSLSVMGDQREMIDDTQRSSDWRMQFQTHGGTKAGLNQWDLPAEFFETLVSTRFLQVLMCNLGHCDAFLHYLTRFEDPQKIHNLLLWKELNLYENAWNQQASQSEIHYIARQIFQRFEECSAGCRSNMQEFAQHLQKLFSFGSEDLQPSTFKPITHYILPDLVEAWLHYFHHEVTSFLEYCLPASHFDTQSFVSKDHETKQVKSERVKKQKQQAWLHNSDGRDLHRKKGRKKAVPKSNHLEDTVQASRERSPTPQDVLSPQNVSGLLSNTAVLNVYKKAAVKMQDEGLQRILGLLQEIEACQDIAQNEKRLDCVKKLLDIWNISGDMGSSACLSKELKLKLKDEVAKREISDLSWNEIRLSLFSFLAPAFEQFWDEVSEGLKKCGVQPSHIPEERWCKLEPFLDTIAAKVVLKRLRNQKAQDGSSARAKATKDDKMNFCQALKKAAEGWPTIEMLHFLKHLQMQGSPVLESGLHFLLEVQKFKNANHGWPDTTLLKKKVLVIRDCFLASQIEPRLQVAMDTQRLGRAIRAAEQALQQEIPPPPLNLFDELKNSIFNILLPYWAAFHKHWLKRSPESTQKAPVLRNQLLLQKRQAMLKGPKDPAQPFLLPPLQHPVRVQGSHSQNGFTYTFSISKGLALQCQVAFRHRQGLQCPCTGASGPPDWWTGSFAGMLNRLLVYQTGKFAALASKLWCHK